MGILNGEKGRTVITTKRNIYVVICETEISITVNQFKHGWSTIPSKPTITSQRNEIKIKKSTTYEVRNPGSAL